MRGLSRLIALLLALLAIAAMPPVVAQQTTDLNVLFRQVEALRQAGRFREAVPLAEQLVKGAIAQVGPEQPGTASMLNTLGIVYGGAHRWREAEGAYRRSLAIWEKVAGANHPEVAAVVNNLGSLLVGIGRHAEAEPFYRRAVTIYETSKGDWQSEQAASLGNLAGLYRDLGRIDEAADLFRRTIAIAERRLGAEHQDVAEQLNGLGSLYKDQGRLAEAQGLYERSLAIRRKALGDSHPRVAASLNNLGLVAKERGRLDQAEQFLRQSLAIREAVEGRDGVSVAESLENLAELYRARGKADEALPLIRRSVAIQHAVLGADHPSVVSARQNLALILAELKQLVEAEALLTAGIAAEEKAFGADHARIAGSLRNLGIVRLRQDRLRDALEAFRRAARISTTRARMSATIPEQALRDDDVASVRQIIATSWRLATARPADREPLMREAFEAAQWANLGSVGAAVSQMAARAAAGNPAVAGLVREQQDLVRRRQQLDEGLIGELSRPPSGRDKGHIASLRRDEAAAADRLRTLAAEIAKVSPGYASLAAPSPISTVEVAQLLGPDEAMIVLAPNGPDATFVWAVTKEASDWQRLDLSGPALIEKVKALRQGIDVDDLAKAASDGRLFDLGVAHELYERLLAPVAPIFASKRHLLIVAAGSLTSVPLQMLVTDTPPVSRPDARQIELYRQAAWLARRHAVTTLPSVASLKALRSLARASAATRPLLGFADPVFRKETAASSREKRDRPSGRTATRSFSAYWQRGTLDHVALRTGLLQLPETADELRAIAAQLGASESEQIFGSSATEVAVKQADLARYRVLYFATHGLVAGEVSGLAEPALVFTLPQTPSQHDDGLLTASEVAQLKLDADWVVLSACNTAAGGEPGAEALSGLARAFFYAGSRALLVSHWRVDTKATVRLMTGTFAELRAEPSIGRAEALRRAMLAMIDDPSTPWSAYPDFWAAFSVVGEGRR